MIRLLTAGETHGKAISAIIDGFPSNVGICVDDIDMELKRRQGGYGRGGRMNIESDRVEIISGIRGGKTLGSPISLLVNNKDYENWQDIMGVLSSNGEKAVTVPRPGHADLSGYIKYDHSDIRNVLERASARETSVRVAVGSICKQFLENFGIKVLSHVVSINEVCSGAKSGDVGSIMNADQSKVRFAVGTNEGTAISLIDKAKESGESLGGVVEVVVTGVPVGLGSYTQYDRKLDANIAMDIMSVQAIKGVEFGLGFVAADTKGSMVHDEIAYKDKEYIRLTNNAGGIEGGMSNGENIIFRAAMKPIPTLYNPLKSVDVFSKDEILATIERSDICAVPACSVVLEAVTAFAITKAFLEKFGGDSLGEIKRNYDGYIKYIEQK